MFWQCFAKVVRAGSSTLRQSRRFNCRRNPPHLLDSWTTTAPYKGKREEGEEDRGRREEGEEDRGRREEDRGRREEGEEDRSRKECR